MIFAIFDKLCAHPLTGVVGWLYNPGMAILTETRKVVVCRCERCGKEWTPQKGIPPKVCRHCRSRLWNEAKEQGVTNDEGNYPVSV